jgi:hypothetical protein
MKTNTNTHTSTKKTQSAPKAKSIKLGMREISFVMSFDYSIVLSERIKIHTVTRHFVSG